MGNGFSYLSSLAGVNGKQLTKDGGGGGVVSEKCSLYVNECNNCFLKSGEHFLTVAPGEVAHFIVMVGTSKLYRVRANCQYAFGVPWLNCREWGWSEKKVCVPMHFTAIKEHFIADF